MGRLRSVQLTKLTREGTRALSVQGDKLPKIHYGLAKGSFLTLQEDKTSDCVFIAEGLETALSLKEAGIKGKIVASMGIHNISNYQGSEKKIILCGDNDERKKTMTSSLTAKSHTHTHTPTHALLLKSKDHFESQGKSVTLITPTQAGDDFNDVLKKQGLKEVRSYLTPYLDPEKQQLHQQHHHQQLQHKPHYRGGKTKDLETIADYVASNLEDIKIYEGTAKGERAKERLETYLETLREDKALYKSLKTEHKDLFKESEKLMQSLSLGRDRGIHL